MTKVFANRVKVNTSTTGTGTIILGTALSGYQTFEEGGVANSNTVSYVIEDGDNWEIGTGTYTSSGTTLSRTVVESNNSDQAVNLSGTAVVFISAVSGDYVPTTGGTMTGDVLRADNVKAKFGTGNDLEIYHDGSHSVIHDVGEGHLKLLGQDLIIAKESAGLFNNEYYIYCSTDGGVFLYYDGSAKMGTVSDGISVVGNITVSGNVDGRDVASDGTKLDGIATGATAYTNANAISAVTGADLDMDGNKVLFSNMYATLGDLPSATDNHGMFAHVHATGKGYFAHGGNWVALANASDVTSYTHPNHSGEVTSTGDGSTVISDNVVDEANLKVSNAPTNGYVLTAQSGNTGGLTWAAASGGGSSTLDGLSDVSTSGVTSGQVLKYNGSNWSPASDNTGSGGGGITTGKAIAMAMVFG